jgi:hypothetical protein
MIMENYEQSAFYFNNIETKEILNEYELLNKSWQKKNLIIKNHSYVIEFLSYNNEKYFKTIKKYNTDLFNKIFYFDLLKLYRDNKIVLVKSYY